MLIRKTSQPVFWKSVVHGMIIGHKGWPFGTGWDGGPSDAHTSTKHVVSESSVTCVSCLTHTQHHVHLGVDKSKERCECSCKNRQGFLRPRTSGLGHTNKESEISISLALRLQCLKPKKCWHLRGWLGGCRARARTLPCWQLQPQLQHQLQQQQLRGHHRLQAHHCNRAFYQRGSSRIECG